MRIKNLQSDCHLKQKKVANGDALEKHSNCHSELSVCSNERSVNSGDISLSKAYAKLNLGLKVVGKRADGYHLLKTIFCLINLYDEIYINVNQDNSEISLLNHSSAWLEQDDLAYKAAKLLQKHSNIKLGANITVKKNIPIGAGMGGGSSDAATVLLVLNKLWNINLSQQELINLSLNLGADVPFFIYGKNAFAEGIGEILSPIKLKKKFFVLVLPSFGLSTKEIFANLNLNSNNLAFHDTNVKFSTLESIKNNNLNPEDHITPKYLLKTLDNDLEAIARKLNPELDCIFMDLKNYANPAMTGTGSTIYLRFDDLNSAKKVALELEKKYNSFLVSSL